MQKNEKTTIVFFGSGPVALESLRGIKEFFNIEFVVTKTTTASIFADIVSENKIITVNNSKELDVLIATFKFYSACAVLVDFGIILSKFVINKFKKGIINSHFSVLPELRGPDPITFSILEGKLKTGVSLMKIVEKMDEGPIIYQSGFVLTGAETASELTNKLIKLSNKIINNKIPDYLEGKIVPVEQDRVMKINKRKISYTRKLTRADGFLNPVASTAIELERKIRAFEIWPKPKIIFSNNEIIVKKAKILPDQGPPGLVTITENKQIIVFCKDKSLLIEKLQPPGKKPMPASDYLRGLRQKT